MGTNTEVKEVEVLTPEQIKALPENVKENVVFLTENMNQESLMVLNPLVSRLLALRDRASKLSLEKDEKGEFKKESIEEYKEVKKDQRSFNGDLGRTSKTLQKPHQDINKGILAIKSTFKDLSDEVKALAEKKFADYEAEETRKAEERQKAKDKKFTDEIEKATKEADELKEKTEKSNIYNAIKFTEIAENISDKVSDAIVESNEQTLATLKAQIAQKTFETITANLATEKLDEEVLGELKESFSKAKNRSIALIDDKLEKYQLDREKNAREYVSSSEGTTGTSGPPPPPSGVDYENDPRTGPGWNEDPEPMNPDVPTGSGPLNNDQFVQFILNGVSSLEDELDKRIAEGVTPDMANLKQKFLKFHEA